MPAAHHKQLQSSDSRDLGTQKLLNFKKTLGLIDGIIGWLSLFVQCLAQITGHLWPHHCHNSTVHLVRETKVLFTMTEAIFLFQSSTQHPSGNTSWSSCSHHWFLVSAHFTNISAQPLGWSLADFESLIPYYITLYLRLQIGWIPNRSVTLCL